MRQDEAIQDLLKRAGRELTASEIADGLKRGGFQFRAKKDPSGSIYVTLNTNAKNLYSHRREGKKAYFGLAEKKNEAQAGNPA